MKNIWQILVVDDEEVMCESMAAWLREDGYRVDTASRGRQAVDMAAQTDYAIYFIDLKMPGGMDGIETLMEIHRLRPEASVVIITAYATVDTAIQAMKEGAQEYIVKPCNPQEISMLVSRIIKVKNLQRENAILRRKLDRQYRFHDLLSKNPRMLAVFELVRDVADQRSTVLIQGESGTGKELVARVDSLLQAPGSINPFITYQLRGDHPKICSRPNSSATRRAPSPAPIAQRKGKFELADGGTIFLDEIGDISPKLQADLLRVLQERAFYRVGGSEEVRVDVRVIAATNKDLQQAIRDGVFRDDLYYRLNVIWIHPAAAGAARGRPAAGPSAPGAARPRIRPRGRSDLRGGAEDADRLRLAGQRARAGERPRARHRELQDPHAGRPRTWPS